jgi:hypothetical protein
MQEYAREVILITVLRAHFHGRLALAKNKRA